MNRVRHLWSGLSGGLRDAVLYGASLGWTKALSMLLLPLLTAALAPADFARLELLSSAAEIGALFAGAGLVDTAYRFASGGDEEGRRAAAEILGLGSMIALVGTVLVLAAAAPLAGLMPLKTRPIEIALLGTAVALESLIAMPLAMLRMRGRAAGYAGTVALRATLQSGLVAALVGLGFGVTGVLAAGATTALTAAALLVWRQARETGWVVAPRHWGRLLAYGLPLVGGGLASFVLGTADRWLLAGQVPAADLGQYALAAKIAMVAALLTQPFELWWYPRRIGLLQAPDGLARSARTVTAGAALTLLAAASAAVAGPLLIQLLAPVTYHPAMAYVPWLAAALALQSLGSLVNVGCYAARTGLRPLLVNAVAAAVALAFYLLLIPRYGVGGAIAATLVAQTVRLVLFLVLSQRLVRLELPGLKLVVPALACAAAAALPQLAGPGWAGPVCGMAALLVALLAAMGCGALPTPTGLRRRGGLAHA